MTSESRGQDATDERQDRQVGLRRRARPFTSGQTPLMSEMTDHPHGPRIPPLSDADLDATQRELIGGDGLRLNIFLTLARYPGLLPEVAAVRRQAPRGRQAVAARPGARDPAVRVPV